MWIQHLGTQFIGGFGRVRLMVGSNDLRDFFNWNDHMILYIFVLFAALVAATVQIESWSFEESHLCLHKYFLSYPFWMPKGIPITKVLIMQKRWPVFHPSPPESEKDLPNFTISMKGLQGSSWTGDQHCVFRTENTFPNGNFKITTEVQRSSVIMWFSCIFKVTLYSCQAVSLKAQRSMSL